MKQTVSESYLSSYTTFFYFLLYSCYIKVYTYTYFSKILCFWLYSKKYD
jgi:hypothetical protein